MYQPLVPCPSCSRHVLAAERACPFCSAALPSDLASRAIPSAARRLTRAAAFVFGASLAVTACGSDVTTGGDSAATSGGQGGDGPDDDGGVQALYGDAAPEDAGTDDDGGSQALYGGPTPVDAGPDDDGGNQAEYGGPPPPIDGGSSSDDGGGAPLYGAPPPPPKP